ncbi:MAG: alpha-N-arabinofuranosidase [Candidatus Sumerlaeota bacterium]|nr:alpha-N-arabinofuranosidase [Candidatus Sumerlaeota bacterium]
MKHWRFLLSLAAIFMACQSLSRAAEAFEASLVLRAGEPGPKVNRNIYGHFAEHLGRCIYEGLWVGEDSPIPNTRGIRNDTVAALKALDLPVLRWPGGCFADMYHWKDGIGPREKRPKIINTHWGGVVENNHFGTHEFLDLCEQLGCEPYICGNVGSGSPQEMCEWIDYMTSDADSPLANLRRQNGRDKPWRVRYFGVGNENWGCGGNMRPEYYADVYRHFQTYVKNYSGNQIYRIACGANGGDTKWTEALMSIAGTKMQGLSLHYYTNTGGKRIPATQIAESDWHTILRRTLKMDELITTHAAIMDRYDPGKRVGMIVDEWGTWYAVEPGTNPGFLYQQNTLRDALVAALNFHIFHRHADRVTMANIAQTINVLQAMILTDKEKMLRTPTYHVFEMFKVHQGGTFLPVDVTAPPYKLGSEEMPSISASATRNGEGVVHLSLVNANPNAAAQVICAINGITPKSVSGRVLTAPEMNAHNTFDKPDSVRPAAFDGAKLSGGKLNIALPAKAVVILEMK